jgi:putative redox protein
MDRANPLNEATARQTGTTFTHRVAIRDHQLVVDEPKDLGGEDQGPDPQELLAASVASCTAITVEMYARRKGWDIGPVDVQCRYTPAERGQPTVFELVLRLPGTCSEEQVEKLSAIAAKCPVRRTLEGEIVFSERVEQRSPEAPAEATPR